MMQMMMMEMEMMEGAGKSGGFGGCWAAVASVGLGKVEVVCI